MSTTTDVLSLFKYDPVADADSTFNITQALNNNWDKLDAAILLAIAAAGAYNPEESYAVGDYCTYKGKLRKCSTAIPTGEAWTEAHWTTTTVAAEMQELSSQLSNLAGNRFIQLGLSLMNYTTVISAINTITVDCSFFAVSGHDLISASDSPFPTSEVQYLVLTDSDVRKTAVAIRYAAGYPQIATRGVIDGNWLDDDWLYFSTATPPQEFNLPLVDGISGTAKYSKDQFGIVRVYVAVLKNSGTITNNEILGTLPEGFRPKHNFAVVGFGNSNQNNIADRHPINMIISSNGNITAFFLSETDGTKIASLYGTAEFLTES